MAKNLPRLARLACKFVLDQSERKSTQVHSRPGQTESQVDPTFQLASPCESVWPSLENDLTRFIVYR